jgi:hypothetical protein
MYVGEEKEKLYTKDILTLLQMDVSILMPFHASMESITL